jgi:hypothetical protein
MDKVVTYFGDVATLGNTLVFQNLTSQGNYSIFSGNVNPAVTATTSLTTGGTLFTTNSNTPTLNVTSLYGTTGVVGIGTVGRGATLNVAGNVWSSNALSAQNVFATTSANVTTLNTSAIFGTSGRVGINTTASTVWTLNVAGNVYVSNAIGAQNVFAASFANVTNLITTRIVSTTGFIGINCAGGGATLNVAGNVWASNALAARNVFATTSANLNSLNTEAIFGSSTSVGIGVIGSGSTLNVLGNVYVSNGLAAANVAPTMNANIVTTNVTYMNLFTSGLGINGPAQDGTNLTGGAPFFVGGTLNGDAAPVNDAPTSNLALKFSTSSSSYVNMGTTSPSHVNIGTTSIFVEAWIYLTSISSTTVNIASYGNGTTSGWSLRLNSTSVSANIGGKNTTLSVSVASGIWNYVAFQYNAGDSTVYVWKGSNSATATPASSTAVAPTYSASDPFYIGAINGVGGLAGGTLYIRDLRIISAADLTNTSTFTPEQAPFSIAPPIYAPGSGVIYNWGLQASSNLYQVPRPLVKVAGNVWCSNAFQGQGIFTNVLADTSNLVSTAIKQIFSPAAGGIVGIGQVPVVDAATLQVTGNVFASNALQSSNILATSANAIVSNINSITNSNQRVGINNASPTSNLYVSGNVLVTDYITTGIANTVRANVDTTNVLSIEGKVGIKITTVALGPTLNIFGNVYVSNALTGTIRSPFANTTTLNIASAYGTSGRVGFNIAPVADGPTLQFGTGNVHASNAISGQNVIVTTIQTYNEDLTRRSPHLRPTTANYVSILNWIAASCNTTQKVGWSVASVPTFSTATVGVTGSALYSSSLLGPDGRVYFTPCNATNIGVFNPKTNEFSTIVPSGASLTSNYKYGSSVLCPNGNIAFISNAITSGVLTFNPIAKTVSTSGGGGGAFYNGGVLGPNGHVYFPIYTTGSASYVREYNPDTMVVSTPFQGQNGFSSAVLTASGNLVGIPWTSDELRVWNMNAGGTYAINAHGQTTPAFSGGVLVPDGNVVCVPYSSENITLYDPDITTMTHVVHGCGTGAFSGGVLISTGNVVFVPFNASNVGMFDPVAQTYSNLVSVGTAAGKYSGGTLLPDGRVIMAQYNASNVGILNTRTPVSVEFCRSPYFNKF